MSRCCKPTRRASGRWARPGWRDPAEAPREYLARVRGGTPRPEAAAALTALYEQARVADREVHRAMRAAAIHAAERLREAT